MAECYFQVPELRGFEKFCEGRPVEEMPRITPRICGVCPEAHMMASAKACDAVYGVDAAADGAKLLRELQYNIFFVTDHTTHFYALGAPDFVMGPDSDPAARNLIGVIRKLGVEIGGEVIKCRQWGHEAASIFGGKPVNPINAIPGGMSKPINVDERDRLEEIARFMVEFGKFTLKLLHDVVLANQEYVDLILNGPYYHETYSMGLVDEKNRVNFYDGRCASSTRRDRSSASTPPRDYLEHVAEHVEPWSYLKFPYLKQVGWKGFVDGKESGVYRATPQSRLNVADGMNTPLAQEAYEEYFETLTGDRSGKQAGPPHPGHPLGPRHRADERRRAVARAGAASRDHAVRTNYRVDPDRDAERGGRHRRGAARHAHAPLRDRRAGLVRKANLIVGTTNNHAAICMSIKKAAQGLIRKGVPVTEGMLNRIEMAFRAYDPCFGCATHSLPGQMPLAVRVRDADGTVVDELTTAEWKRTLMAEIRNRYDALVIGGGIAGMQAALDLGEQGFEVLLVDRYPSIGGVMVGLNKVFPTLDCSSCICTPRMAEAAHHDRDPAPDLHRGARRSGGTAPASRCSSLLKPRYVERGRLHRLRRVRAGLPDRRAPRVRLRPRVAPGDLHPARQRHPAEGRADPRGLRLLRQVREGLPHALHRLHAGSPGASRRASAPSSWPPASRSRRWTQKPEYGGGKLANVMSPLQMERVQSSNGPYGRVLRPADGKIPRSIAYVQCAGSRDRSIGVPYCSRVCCMYALKQALLLRHYIHGVDVTLYHMDIRAFGKGYEQFYRRAMAEGVKVVKGKVGKITEVDNHDLLVRGSSCSTRTVASWSAGTISSCWRRACPRLASEGRHRRGRGGRRLPGDAAGEAQPLVHDDGRRVRGGRRRRGRRTSPTPSSRPARRRWRPPSTCTGTRGRAPAAAHAMAH